MTEIYYFQCDYCEANFQYEEFCLKHEWEEHRYQKIAKDLVLLNDGRQIPFTYGMDIDRIDCIKVYSQEAAIFINAYFLDRGYDMPITYQKGTSDLLLGAYYWDDTKNGAYVNAMDKITQILNSIGTNEADKFIFDILKEKILTNNNMEM